MKTAAMLVVLLGVLVAVGPLGSAEEGVQALSPEQQLTAFAGKMRLSLSMAAFAAFSPSLPDARAQAERLLVMLRGDAGGIGLVQEADFLLGWVSARGLDPERERTLLGAAENVRGFLKLALASAIGASRGRALEPATQDLLRAYAFLLAAWGPSVDGVSVPGLALLLRAFDIPVTV